MKEFLVRRYSDAGVPETEMSKIEAENELEAAEKACGIKLTDKQRSNRYTRADVRTTQTMSEHHLFYAVE
ncbi:MAG TPA: hypothetical protein VGG48_12700 [Rhizomicrobium sp.]